MKYRKKPIVVEAMKWSGVDLMEIAGFVEGSLLVCPGEVYIMTERGNLEVTPGDYIVKGVNGEFYPCKPDIFEKTYEKAED